MRYIYENAYQQLILRFDLFGVDLDDFVDYQATELVCAQLGIELFTHLVGGRGIIRDVSDNNLTILIIVYIPLQVQD